MQYVALLILSAYAQENISVHNVLCYLETPLELSEETVLCENQSLQVRNGSKAVLEGSVTCRGEPVCPKQHRETLLFAQRAFTYGGGALIFVMWGGASLLGLMRMPRGGVFFEGGSHYQKVVGLHGFSGQILGLNLCFVFLIVSMTTVGCNVPDRAPDCDFDLTLFILSHLSSRLLLSLALFVLMIAGVIASKTIWIMKDMPKTNFFLPWQEAESFARTALELEPVWMDRAVQVPQRPRKCWIWENSEVCHTLESMAEGWKDRQGRDFKLEIEIQAMDDFTMDAMKDAGGYFMMDIDDHRLTQGFDQKHYLHFTARKGHCGMDFFWSHFWPMFKSSVMMLSLYHAATEADADLEVLPVRKVCRLLPPQELKHLLQSAQSIAPGENGCVPRDYASVQRVAEWRRRALHAASRSSDDQGDPTVIGAGALGALGALTDEVAAPHWVYQGRDLEEEIHGIYADGWRKGRLCRQDWFRLIGKAEFWLACAFLELNRREPGLGHPLESACEVLHSGLALGRLCETFPGCQRLVLRAQKVLEQELCRAVLAVERAKLDRLNAALPKSRTVATGSLMTMDMKNYLIAHSSHALRLAVTMREQQALGYALIEVYRLNGDALRQGHPLGLLAIDARQLFQTLVIERSALNAGLAPSMLRQIFEQHSCFTPSMRASWVENVASASFRADMQACMDLIGAKKRNGKTLASELEVVEIQYVEHPPSMQTYLARREELKVCVHPKCAGQAADAQTIGPLGPWTHAAIRRCQGLWADKTSFHWWLIAGEEVLNAATLVAETLEPEFAQILRAEHGLMNFRALPWPHLLSRPECGDTDSEVSLIWVVSQFSHSSRTNVKQINGVFQDADLNVVFWNSGHKDNTPARWDRSPVIYGSWCLEGREALLLPMEVYFQAALLLDTLAIHQGSSAEHKSELEAKFFEMRSQGVPENYRDILYYQERFYPIWEDRPGMMSCGQFRSLLFSGTVDKSHRRMEIQPFDVPEDLLEPPFCRRLGGFRRGITARLSPKPLDLNVNELYLLQGTTAQFQNDDPSSVQLQVLGSHSGASEGSGIYLTDSAFKADQYTEEHPNGLCAMLFCRVCLGRIINQSEGDRNSNSMRRGSEYHSVKVSQEVNEYVIFDPSQVYVEYLVWYRRRYQKLCES